MPHARILVVDDEQPFCSIVCDVLSKQGYDVTGVETGEDGQSTLQKGPWDLVVCDLRLPRNVALKFLPEQLTVDEETTARFIREAQAAAAIEHPNICSIHEISETDDGQIFIVSFKFLENPNQLVGPSLVNDTDGCQNGKNTIDAQGLGWVSSCLLGVGGDWVIRAVVECETAAAGPGSVPNGFDAPGVPMRMDLTETGQLEFTWSDSCSASDNNYEVYHGFMGAYYSHFSKLCTTGGATTVTFPTDMFDRYFLVVPTDGTEEGSYGRDGTGTERPRGGGVCHSQQSVNCP